ncbi:MAG: glycosyltransferase [Faecousia sp.]
MAQTQTICLLNDSFPPLIDGVANAVKNYAQVIFDSGYESVVITPAHPDSSDEDFPFPIIRYPSLDFRKMTGGYMAGIPFSPDIAKQLAGKKVALLHSHCPIISTVLARELRQVVDAPLVITYHTKFDIDIANILKSKALRAGSTKALVQNINACDEVWAVSRGAAENLRSLGYEGECIVMPNGVDLPRQRVPEDAVARATAGYDLPSRVPVFLFVGRMMWYKGLKITIDALALLKQQGEDFRMVFIGSGSDLDEVVSYAESCGIAPNCIFTGAIRDREKLRAWYCRANLFLFPSTFDTNGLVVREAAACSLGAVLVEGSCAAEGITHGQNGLLIEENAESMFTCLRGLLAHPGKMAEIGENAGTELYLSWQDAVKQAMDRYQIVIDRYQSGGYPARREPVDNLLKANGSLMEDLANWQLLREEQRKNFRTRCAGKLPELKDKIQTHIHERFER